MRIGRCGSNASDSVVGFPWIVLLPPRTLMQDHTKCASDETVHHRNDRSPSSLCFEIFFYLTCPVPTVPYADALHRETDTRSPTRFWNKKMPSGRPRWRKTCEIIHGCVNTFESSGCIMGVHTTYGTSTFSRGKTHCISPHFFLSFFSTLPLTTVTATDRGRSINIPPP